MGFFVIAVVLLTVGIIVTVSVDVGFFGPTLVLVVLAIVFGLFANWGGYEEAYVATENELMSLIEDTNIYLIQSEDGTRMCKYQIASIHDKEVKNVVVKKIPSYVEIEYIEEGLKPVLREYVSKPKKSKWNGLFADTKEYEVLFVPESYIVK